MRFVKNTSALVLVLIICSCCNGQEKTARSAGVTIDDRNKRLKIKDHKPPGIHTETESGGITIQNSFPKGDGYPASDGRIFGVAIFWTRIVNETSNPLELALNFSADTLAIPGRPESSLKLFLLPDTMMLDKISLYGYGIQDLKPLLDTGLNKPTKLQKTINAKGEWLFYVAVIRDPNVARTPRKGDQEAGGGVVRTGLVLSGQELLYKVSLDADSVSIPCGQVVIKK